MGIDKLDAIFGTNSFAIDTSAESTRHLDGPTAPSDASTMAFPPAIVRQTALSKKPAAYSREVALLGILLLMLSSGAYWENLQGLAPYLAANPEKVFTHGEYWRLFTTILIHADLEHLLGNCISFGVLSYLLFGYFGAGIFPITAFIAGTVVNAFSLRTYPSYTVLVGASGVVYWMAGFWLTLYAFVDRRYPIPKRLLRSTGFGLVVLIPSTIQPTTSYRTHAIGFALGVICGIIYFLMKRRELRAKEIVEYEEEQDAIVWN